MHIQSIDRYFWKLLMPHFRLKSIFIDWLPWSSSATIFKGLSAGKLCILGNLGIVFIWSCFVSYLVFLLFYVNLRNLHSGTHRRNQKIKQPFIHWHVFAKRPLFSHPIFCSWLNWGKGRREETTLIFYCYRSFSDLVSPPSLPRTPGGCLLIKEPFLLSWVSVSGGQAVDITAQLQETAGWYF